MVCAGTITARVLLEIAESGPWSNITGAVCLTLAYQARTNLKTGSVEWLWVGTADGEWSDAVGVSLD